MPFGTPDPIKPGAATGAPTSTPQNVIMPTVQQQQAAAAQQQAQAAQQAQFSQPMTSAGSIGTGIRSLASGHGMPGPTNAQGQPMGSSVINKLAQLRATNFSPTANSMSTGASGGMQGAPMGAGTGGVDGAGIGPQAISMPAPSGIAQIGSGAGAGAAAGDGAAAGAADADAAGTAGMGLLV